MRKKWAAQMGQDVAPVVAPVHNAPKPRRDPWYSDDARREGINAASSRTRRWIVRRPHWLR